MAFDLIGRIKLEDRGATKTLARVKKQMEQVKKATGGLTSSTAKYRSAQAGIESQGKRVQSMLRGVGSAATGAGRAFQGARSHSMGLMRSIVGLGAAYVSFKSISGLASMSIGGAANLELQGIQLEALIGSASKAKQLFDSMNAKGLKSTFSETDFLEGAKAFLPLTKSLTQIDTLTSLQERLASSNPLEGMQGAAFSIREALSGDTVSLAERFNMPKTLLTNLKKASTMTGKIKALDSILNKMGFTQVYLNKVNESASAQWDNLGSNIKMSFARSGKQALEMLKPFLKDMNAFLSSDRASRMFQRWGQALGKLALAAADFGRWLIDRGGKAFDYLDKTFFSNEKFQKLPFADKIQTVFTDIEQKFRSWYDGGGKKMIQDGTQKLIEIMATALKASESLARAAVDIGVAIGEGMVKGILSVKTLKTLLPDPLREGTFVDWGDLAKANGIVLPATYADRVGPAPKGYASGLDRVPYSQSGTVARLHHDEMVLTRTEANDYRAGQGGKGGAPVVNITGNTFHVRNDMDIEKVAWKLAHYMAD